jgi:hypothetical protein
VAGCIQGDQRHGVLFPLLLATVHGVLGHSEAAEVLSGQAWRRRPTRERRAKAQPVSPRDRHARAGVHDNAGRRVSEMTHASASVNANATGSARRRGLERHRTTDTTIRES